MPATNDELLAALREIREEIKESNRVLSGKASRWSVRAVGLSVALSLAVALGGVGYAVDENHHSCIEANEARADTRRMVHDAMIESSEAIIAIAEDAEPAQIKAFRAETTRRSDAIVAQLPDREC